MLKVSRVHDSAQILISGLFDSLDISHEDALVLFNQAIPQHFLRLLLIKLVGGATPLLHQLLNPMDRRLGHIRNVIGHRAFRVQVNAHNRVRLAVLVLVFGENGGHSGVHVLLTLGGVRMLDQRGALAQVVGGQDAELLGLGGVHGGDGDAGYE